jgi:fermentation-respiration switch protein FrsA (DUF1100 family)
VPPLVEQSDERISESSLVVPGMIYEWFYEFSRTLNVNVMAYDYTGYGKSTGTPSEAACYADIEAAFDYLMKVGPMITSPPPKASTVQDAAHMQLHTCIILTPACFAPWDIAPWSRQVKKVSPRSIVLYGRSIGSGPTCYLNPSSPLHQRLPTISTHA